MKDFILGWPWVHFQVSFHCLERDLEDSSQNGDVLRAQYVGHFREDDRDDAHARDGGPQNAPPAFHDALCLEGARGNAPPCACRYDVPHSYHFGGSASPAFRGAGGAEPAPMSLSYLMKMMMMMSQSLKKSSMMNWMKKIQMSLNWKKKSLKTPPP